MHHLSSGERFSLILSLVSCMVNLMLFLVNVAMLHIMIISR